MQQLQSNDNLYIIISTAFAVASSTCNSFKTFRALICSICPAFSTAPASLSSSLYRPLSDSHFLFKSHKMRIKLINLNILLARH